MVRASVLQSVDLGFNPVVEQLSHTKRLQKIFTAFLLGTWHLGEFVENKPANLLVVSLGKALNMTPHIYVADRWPRHL